MKLDHTMLRPDNRQAGRVFDPALVASKRSEAGSVLIIVLWMALGLVAIALYFANSMNFEFRASDNRISGLGAEQTIEGAARYVKQVLIAYATNGAVPVNTEFSCEEVPVGDCKFWIIGRDTSGTVPTKPYFGLVDDGSKLNLNFANSNALVYLPNMTAEIANAITDWRDTNGTMTLNNALMGYSPKHAPFETVDEIRLVDRVTLSLLDGADVNHNGILDSNEKNTTSKSSDEGLLEYLTIYSREPNFRPDGTSYTNASTANDLYNLLVTHFDSTRATQIMTTLGFTSGGGGGPGGGGGGGATSPSLTNAIQFYYQSQLPLTDFEMIYNDLSFTTNGMYIFGRVNVNTASAEVLYALFVGIGAEENDASTAAQTLVDYRAQNSDSLSTVGWVVDALGRDNNIVTLLRRGDYVTTRSYQFTADIVATGPMGRGYHRVKFVFDTSDGTPKIIYRQDLSRLGWALGDTVRETLLAKDTQ